MSRQHHYRIDLSWTGNRGEGTANYRAYGRDHLISAPGKPPMAGSSDPSFRGDADRYNPEELLVASLSACHMLWYLHVCAVEGIVVVDYRDDAAGVMVESADGGGRFESVTLRPRVTLAAHCADRQAQAERLHAAASDKCFIANSVNFPVHHEAQIHIMPPVDQ